MEREHALAPLGAQAWKSALPVEQHTSTWIGDRAVELVRSAAGQRSGRGSCGRRSRDPHGPLCPPAPYADRYDPAARPGAGRAAPAS